MNLGSLSQNEPIRVPGLSVNICYRNKSRQKDLDGWDWETWGKQVVKGRHESSTFLLRVFCKRSSGYLHKQGWRWGLGRAKGAARPSASRWRPHRRAGRPQKAKAVRIGLSSGTGLSPQFSGCPQTTVLLSFQAIPAPALAVMGWQGPHWEITPQAPASLASPLCVPG